MVDKRSEDKITCETIETIARLLKSHEVPCNQNFAIHTVRNKKNEMLRIDSDAWK